MGTGSVSLSPSDLSTESSPWEEYFVRSRFLGKLQHKKMWYEFSSSQSQLLPTQNVTSNNNNKEINITMRLNPGKGTSSFDLSDFHGPKFFNSLKYRNPKYWLSFPVKSTNVANLFLSWLLVFCFVFFQLFLSCLSIGLFEFLIMLLLLFSLCVYALNFCT